VVTHVPSLAERIPVRFEVTKDTRSAHVVRVEP
jgi:exonuclease SbcC